MLEALGPLITAIKNGGPPIYGASFIATSLMLFLPDPVIARLGLIDFRQSNRLYWGLALLGSASLLAVYVVAAVASLVQDRWENKRISRMGLKALSELTFAEKQFLQPFILEGENTHYTAISNGVARGLEAKTLIFRSSTVSSPGGVFPYNLQPYARRLLNKHPGLLD